MKIWNIKHNLKYRYYKKSNNNISHIKFTPQKYPSTVLVHVHHLFTFYLLQNYYNTFTNENSAALLKKQKFSNRRLIQCELDEVR